MFLYVQSFLRPSSDHVIERVSTGTNGEQGNNGSYDGQISTNGRYLVFTSLASNLVAGDTNGVEDIFRKDLVTGEIIRVSTNAGGQEATGGASERAQISADGRCVVFNSNANNLVANDTNGTTDVFLKDIATGAISRVSTGANGEQASGHYAEISADGNYVVFESNASNLVPGDTNGSFDIFRKDLSTGAVTRVSIGSDGVQGFADSFDPEISPNGRYVVFGSRARLVTEDGNGFDSDIYRKDLLTGDIILVSTTATGEIGDGDSYDPQISADGRYVLFESTADNLVARDRNKEKDIFLKDIVTGTITRVNTTATGEEARGYSSNAQFSADGRYVLFQSDALNLVAGDTKDFYDTFRKDLLTGAITRISNTTTGEVGDGDSRDVQISTDGRYVLFESKASNLTAGDTNGVLDMVLVDLHYQPYAAAIAQNRFVETTLSVGAASQVSIAWGDGTSTTQTPVSGQVSVKHAYTSTGTKAAIISLTEGALNWRVAHTIDLAAGTMVRNLAVADTLEGGAGRDSLNGDGTADVLLEAGGNDRLMGYVGNDRLIGGTGKDTLTGSSGQDVFVFDDRETGASKSRADYITDFSGRRGDKIDLKAVDANTARRGDQKFSFIGDEESFSKAGEVRYEKTKGYTYVYLNTDSDQAAEAVIKLKGSFELSKSWFVL